MKASNSLIKNQTKQKKRFAFSCDEDDRLRALVSKYGEDNWAIIASKMKKRSTRQCRDRWINYLSPLAINGTWTPEEDQLLNEKVEIYGRKWKFLTNFFFGRTDINIKNHYNFLQKKLSKEILKQQKNQQQQIAANSKIVKETNIKKNNISHDHIEVAAEIILNSNKSFDDKSTNKNTTSGGTSTTSNSEDEALDFEKNMMVDFLNDITFQLPEPDELMIDYSGFFF